MPESFLLTTTHHLLAFNEDGRFWRVHSGKGLYYGLAQYAGRIYVACRNIIKGPTDPSVRAGENGSILVLEAATLNVIDELTADFPLRDLHGMCCFDGKLWMTCSFDNLVAIYDLTSHRWSRWYPAPDPAARDRDVNHFNTVEEFGNSLCVVAHNNGPSHLLFYDRASLELSSVIQLGYQAHDVFWVNGAAATCSSGDGRLLSSAGWTLRTRGFPRGIAFSASSILVGISQTASCGMRREMSGILRRFTLDWRYCTDYVLKGVGMILALLPVDPAATAAERLEPWTHVERYDDMYNPVEPGDVYALGASNASMLLGPDWHYGEDSLRWMAAREARIGILVNTGETIVSVSAINSFPGPYKVDVYVDGSLLRTIQWLEPGHSQAEFLLPDHTGATCALTFVVPHLWQPAHCLPQSDDQRKLGAGITAVQLR
jgi:hypothetical protein